MVSHSDGDGRKSGSCPGLQARCKSAYFTPEFSWMENQIYIQITKMFKINHSNLKTSDHKIMLDGSSVYIIIFQRRSPLGGAAVSLNERWHQQRVFIFIQRLNHYTLIVSSLHSSEKAYHRGVETLFCIRLSLGWYLDFDLEIVGGWGWIPLWDSNPVYIIQTLTHNMHKKRERRVKREQPGLIYEMDRVIRGSIFWAHQGKWKQREIY